jgi:hypothetical protein
MYIIASISYAISIFIDVFVYYLKLNIHDKNNVRYLFSLINIFQFSARGFVLVFVPIMAYYTETVKDKEMIWNITLLAQFLVVLFLIPLFSDKFSYKLSIKIITLLNIIFGKSKGLIFEKNHIAVHENEQVDKPYVLDKLLFISFSYVSGFMFSFSTSFLYYFSFSYPQKALTLTSHSQILNMIGVLLLVLLIDPKIMSNIDNGKGKNEIRLLTASRIFVHFTLIILLFYIN